MSRKQPFPNSSHGGRGSDPHDQYELTVDLSPTMPGRGSDHWLIAQRQHTSTRTIEALGPTTPKLTAVLQQYINMEVHRDGDVVVTPGVEVTTVFEATAGSGYVPVGILIDGQPLGQLPVGSGFWPVPDELCSLIDAQTERSVTHQQVGYAGDEPNQTHRPDIQSPKPR